MFNSHFSCKSNLHFKRVSSLSMLVILSRRAPPAFCRRRRKPVAAARKSSPPASARAFHQPIIRAIAAARYCVCVWCALSFFVSRRIAPKLIGDSLSDLHSSGACDGSSAAISQSICIFRSIQLTELRQILLPTCGSSAHITRFLPILFSLGSIERKIANLIT